MTNDSVKGYVALTLKSLGYKKEEIEEVLNELYWAFDLKTESEAEQYYHSGKWGD